MFKRFLPKETNFFEFFENHSVKCIDATGSLLQLVSNGQDFEGIARRIQTIEKEADLITHQCIDALHRTFITPIDRSDIHVMIKRMDDIIDSVNAATSRITLYDLREIRDEARDLAQILVKSTAEIGKAVKSLRNLKHPQSIQESCVLVHGLEDEADTILKAAVVRLFQERDPILVIKWKEIYERLEKATDRCDDVANILEKIVIESA
jgi:predicted phosphate transport protein (TIGR00153 family)